MTFLSNIQGSSLAINSSWLCEWKEKNCLFAGLSDKILLDRFCDGFRDRFSCDELFWGVSKILWIQNLSCKSDKSFLAIRVSSQIIISANAKASNPLKVMSKRLPMGVGTRISTIISYCIFGGIAQRALLYQRFCRFLYKKDDKSLRCRFVALFLCLRLRFLFRL